MRAKRGGRCVWGCATLGITFTMLSGCTGSDEFGSESGISSIASLGLGGRAGADEDQSNNSFSTPTSFRLVAGETRSVEGLIHIASDVDIYDIGPVFAGDHLVVDLTGDFLLDASVGIFDANTSLIYVNDDRNFFLNQVDPYIDAVMHRDTDHCYIAVASSAARRSTGRYTLNVSLTDGATDPAPHPQVVLFNFDGAESVAFGGRRAVTIDPFDAATISPTLDGRTEELIELIRTRVEEDYEGLNVEFHTRRDELDVEREFTTVHFGAFDPGLLGVAENVDEFNESTVQEAIVFTDTFEVFEPLNPTIEEYAQAIANVASHETGHLLGLVHTRDIHGIMDITASLRQLTRNQAFLRSPIEGATFVVGSQDAARSLVDAVGGDLDMVRSKSASQLTEARVAKLGEWVEDPEIPRPVLSSCALFCLAPSATFAVAGD